MKTNYTTEITNIKVKCTDVVLRYVKKKINLIKSYKKYIFFVVVLNWKRCNSLVLLFIIFKRLRVTRITWIYRTTMNLGKTELSQ